MRPCPEHWWWRKSRLKRALDANPALDHFLHWKLKGRRSPDGIRWPAAQRREIEVALWLYELDARISSKYLFKKPAHLLTARQLASVVTFALPTNEPAEAGKKKRARRFEWAWVEYFDRRTAKKSARLTRAQLNGIIAAMKFCLEHFSRG
jgi:hypothetical protein